MRHLNKIVTLNNKNYSLTFCLKYIVVKKKTEDCSEVLLT